MTTATAPTNVTTISGKFYRYETVTDSTGTYTAYIPCDADGHNANRCPVCGGHADHRPGLSCGL